MVKNFQLPKFGLDEYTNLLNQFINAGYQFQPVSQMCKNAQVRVVYLRHDVDLHIDLVSAMALVEKDLNVSATYFVPLARHFNLLYPANQQIMRRLIDMGHEIGLHYDMEAYPLDPADARRHLDWEVGVLSKAVGSPIHTICLHNPYKGQPDPFRQIDEYVNPHDPRCQEELLYVSDSCRAWRDENLLTCFGPNPPRRLLLNTHPELWLDGTVRDRIEYLNGVLTDNILREYRDVLENTRNGWLNHPAAKLHDERQRNIKPHS